MTNTSGPLDLQQSRPRIRISDIKVGSRFRKDLGDIKGLTRLIKDVGCLLQPIGINENNDLVFGARRLEACKLLGWVDIPVTVVPIQSMVKGEFYENTGWKDFTVSERVAILEEIENERVGHRTGKGAKLAPFQEREKGKKSRDIVARYTNISPAKLQKEKKIVQVVRENPDDIVNATSMKYNIKLKEMLEKLDKGRMKTNKASTLIRGYEWRKAIQARIEAEKSLPPPPLLTDKEKQELKTEQDRIIKEAVDKYFLNENEYEDDNGIRLIQGNPLEVSFNSKLIPIPVSTVIGKKRTTMTHYMQMERYGIDDNSVDLIFTNPSYALHNMIPEYNRYNPNGYQDPPTYRNISYLADRVLKEGGNIIMGIQYQFHRLIPAIVYFISHNCDSERYSNYGLFHTSVDCDRCGIRFSSIIICDNRLLLLWFRKKKNSNNDNPYSDIEEKNIESMNDVIKQFTDNENDVVLDPLMDYGDVGIAARKLGRRFIGIEQDNERFKTAQLRMEKENRL